MRVAYDDVQTAPVYDGLQRALVYHGLIVDRQMANKGKNGIDRYIQSSLFHELVHAGQMKSGLRPAQMETAADGRQCFISYRKGRLGIKGFDS
ncbi:MAG: hypothetical protein IJ846_04395 [Alphaproteobacteria bacterium]|nr:hypothetical protein [Alphaproteobacteria bacterium]